MDYTAQTLAEIKAAGTRPEALRAVVGLDGFVDLLVTPVAMRHGEGDNFEPIPTLADFGQRILGAAGKSANLELYPKMQKLGGNGPIMANALMSYGVGLTYIGALGTPQVAPVFAEFAERARVISVAEAAQTTAVECDDGKLMLCQTNSLEQVTFDALVDRLGEEGLRNLLGDANLISLVNWTMIPAMTEIFRRLVKDTLPQLAGRDRRFFFDLADPEKRSRGDLLEVLEVISTFEDFGDVTLGLNLKEAQQVHLALGFHPLGEEPDDLRQISADIREKLGYATVVVHPKESAACANTEGTHWVRGPYVQKPKITTGAGDHFNAGFSLGQMLGVSPSACLTLGVATSGHYVRTAESPRLADIETFLANWPE